MDEKELLKLDILCRHGEVYEALSPEYRKAALRIDVQYVIFNRRYYALRGFNFYEYDTCSQMLAEWNK